MQSETGAGVNDYESRKLEVSGEEGEVGISFKLSPLSSNSQF